ncbi:MAG: cation-transporting P-type ATPase [Alphaproteobacteria bacterium]|nr:cation-transporting P-type ATPase [Alphaproteobacteria bacterium]
MVTQNKPIASQPWHALRVEEIEKILSTRAQGLEKEEISSRLAVYGPNEIQDTHPVYWYQMLLSQFQDFMIFILIVAALISAFLGETIDAAVIVAIILLNGALGFFQEWKAENALQQLKGMLMPTCKVIRADRPQTIGRAELVPGDRVLVESGDQVPADLRLVDVLNLRIDEAALTGESLAVEKNTALQEPETEITARSNMAWMGTNITNGRAEGIVIATGMKTEFGKIAALTGTIRRPAVNLKRKMEELAKKLGGMAIAIAVLVTVAGVLNGKDLFLMFMQGVSLAVAAVPEGLPAVVTITLALGVRVLVQRKALLRQLRAAETLGATTVICTDKTGTLTRNEMTVQKVWIEGAVLEVTGSGYAPEGEIRKNGQAALAKSDPVLACLIETGLKCNHARIVRNDGQWKAMGAPTEAALIVLASKAGVKSEQNDRAVAEYSFNSNRKRMSIVEKVNEGFIVHMKGAPEVLLARSTYIMKGREAKPLTDEDRSEINAIIKTFASQGLRTLALARKKINTPDIPDECQAEYEMCFLGVVGVLDPPRPEVPEAIRTAHSAGIKVLMMTGDSPDTAQAVARQIGLPDRLTVSGRDLHEATDAQLWEWVRQDAIFARTVPEDKHRIVKILQNHGKIVAMTGDGVNDAPALKQADIGIAMGVRGTDVAKNAADIILMDDNFVSIISAIEEGRRQYANIRKFVRYLLSSNFGEIIAVFINALIGGPLILLPVQILWMNLVTDGLSALALGLEKAERGIMSIPPRPANQPILDKRGIIIVLSSGTYIGLMTLALFQIYLFFGAGHYELANCIAFTGIIILEKINVFNYRSLIHPLHRIGYLTNLWLLAAVAFTMTLQIMAVYTPSLEQALKTIPLSSGDWLIMLAASLPLLIAGEIYKSAQKKNVRQTA